MRNKQRIDKSEAYFVHIGYTYANELKNRKRRGKRGWSMLKIRPVVQARLDKLNRYWGMALK